MPKIQTSEKECGHAATDPRIDAYIGQSPAFARPILSHLREAVHGACTREAGSTAGLACAGFFRAALDARLAALKNFDAGSASFKHEYADWIAGGKRRNWQYEKC